MGRTEPLEAAGKGAGQVSKGKRGEAKPGSGEQRGLAEATPPAPGPHAFRVGVDAHMVGSRETGNETYVTQLLRALGELGGCDYRAYTAHPRALRQGLAGAHGVDVSAFPNLPAVLRIPALYPALAARDRLALLHMTYIAPPLLPCPVVLSVHDVSYRAYPEYFSYRVRLLLGLLVGPSLRRAAHVLAISQQTKRDLGRYYGVRPGKVTVTPLAAADNFAPASPEAIEQVRARYGLPRRYVLAVGNVEPRKNLRRLVEAFAVAARHDEDCGLVIAGRSKWRTSDVAAAVDETRLNERVVFTGYVEDSDLPALYSGAMLFCYPSIYEGFGLPPLEAMACGVPVITSNTSSLPEVVGEAAIMVDPLSVPALAGALEHLIRDETARAACAARGRRRAALFSWSRTADLTRGVYARVINRDNQRSRRVRA